MATAAATNRKLVLKMSVSLDGFVCGPDGEIDWGRESSTMQKRPRWAPDRRHTHV